MNETFKKAREIIHFNPEAKYLVLSRPALDEIDEYLRGNYAMFIAGSDKGATFMGRKIAIVESDEIIVDVGGIKGRGIQWK